MALDAGKADLAMLVETTQAAARGLGSPLKHPFLTMAHTVLPTLPELGMTDMGLINVASSSLVGSLPDLARASA